MEVFLRNVPKDVTDDALRTELIPHMVALDIFQWHCEKPRRKPQAWIGFLHAQDGQRFLTRHSKLTSDIKSSDLKASQQRVVGFQRLNLRDIARLHILTMPVYVEQSHRKIDLTALRESIESNLRPKALPTKRIDRSLAREPSNILHNVFSIACGKLVLKGESSGLTFMQQTSIIASSDIKFGQSFIVLTTDDSNMIMLPIRIIQDTIVDFQDKSFIFILTEPPRLYEQSNSRGPRQSEWVRSSSLVDWPTLGSYLNMCLVYRVQINMNSSLFERLVTSLKARDLFSITRQSLDLDQHPKPYVDDFSTCIESFNGTLVSLNKVKNGLPFSLLFQIQALVWNNYLHPRAGQDLVTLLASHAEDCRRGGLKFLFTTDAMKYLLHSVPYPSPGMDPKELDAVELLHMVRDRETDLRREDPTREGVHGAKLSDQQAWVLKALITPTRIVLSGPDAESKNRVLRMFPNHHDHFLRVTFADEDGQDLSFNPKISYQIVYERYHRVFQHGLQIAGRQFGFLGFSHSSLRSHSAWFCAPFTDDNMKKQNYSSILQKLGDFQDIRIPAKCAARIGQAFSETPYAVPLNDIRITYMDDVKSLDGSRVFSDGVGTISLRALTKVWTYLPASLGHPTCLQIRVAGVKGMLSLDTRLGGSAIRIRKESMMKFPSRDFQELGICDVSSRPLRLMLNRQMIKILEDMGTSDSWFFALQEKALHVLRGITSSAANTSTFLGYQAIGANVGLPKLINRLEKIGIDYRCHRFLKTVVDHVVLRELRLLKYKARIPVKEGVTLFGVMDETGFLREGQVYVTFDARSKNDPFGVDGSIVDGPVIITRSPALHPGDIQMARMTTPPDGHPLRSLRNCVVFSQKGNRDLPSQLSGGDLDGDMYNIIWDPAAKPRLRYLAADYPRVSPVPLNRKVERDDIAEFFINFMKTDVLGLIANRHQVYADVLKDGTAGPECVTLAEMHSTAVDYSKTGIPVSVRDIPRAPRTKPDFFAPAPPAHLYDLGQISHIEGPEDADNDDEGIDGMGRFRPQYHKSEKILGRLFRAIDERAIWDEQNRTSLNTSKHHFHQQLLKYVDSRLRSIGYRSRINFIHKIDRAKKVRGLYESIVWDNMWQFSDNPRVAITEVEAFCGSIFNKTGSQTRRQRDSSIKLKTEMESVMKWITKLLEEHSDDDATKHGDLDSEDNVAELGETIELCWACLVLSMPKAYGQDKRNDSDHLESFDIVSSSCLLKALDKLALVGN